MQIKTGNDDIGEDQLGFSEERRMRGDIESVLLVKKKYNIASNVSYILIRARVELTNTYY